MNSLRKSGRGRTIRLGGRGNPARGFKPAGGLGCGHGEGQEGCDCIHRCYSVVTTVWFADGAVAGQTRLWPSAVSAVM